MNIFLIIIGGILVLICGAFYLGTNKIMKDPKQWEEFMKKGEEYNLPVSEDYMYRLVGKINFWFGIGIVIGLLLLTSGILLYVAK